ncbi:MAG: AAA family ATPase [Lachnospiraceae bacterium]|nr:AAA family ATPase [Lachnospiraceae bacterium]
MNIKEAKEYIKQTARIYLKKNDLGDYVIPVVRQRPVFMLGAPGVGKTAIMEQIAEELGIALVSYSMTHHTRQSALGLPFILHKKFGEEEVDVSEYTMSEIIATVYEMMEESGIKEGILFLDEINCVSETLAPSMLQFLQYKVFGKHKVPEGWVIVTAGNPPEYNKSVREFDVAVLDRMKIIEVDPDYNIFKEYAKERGLHPAVTSFLDMKRDYFYRIENTVKGRSYVTARGWEDLSEIIKLYEEEELSVEDTLIGQYLTNETVVKEFSAYYDLFNKYKRDYHVKEILKGKVQKETVQKAAAAGFDERLSLLSMLMDKVISDIRENMARTDYLSKLSPILKEALGLSEKEGENGDALVRYFDDTVDKNRRKLLSLSRAGAISREEERSLKRILIFLEDARKEMLIGGMDSVKAMFNEKLTSAKKESKKVSDETDNLFAFVEEAFEEGNEMLILVTEFTVNPYASRFIARFGSDAYARHNRELMLTERQNDMKAEVKELLEEL